MDFYGELIEISYHLCFDVVLFLDKLGYGRLWRTTGIDGLVSSMTLIIPSTGASLLACVVHKLIFNSFLSMSDSILTMATRQLGKYQASIQKYMSEKIFDATAMMLMPDDVTECYLE